MQNPPLFTEVVAEHRKLIANCEATAPPELTSTDRTDIDFTVAFLVHGSQDNAPRTPACSAVDANRVLMHSG